VKRTEFTNTTLNAINRDIVKKIEGGGRVNNVRRKSKRRKRHI